MKDENKVRRWRENAGMTTAELARRIGVTPHKLGRVERDEVMLKAEDAARIAKVLGIDPGKLLDTAGDQEAEGHRSASADDGTIPVYGPARALDQGGIVVSKEAVRGWAERPPELRDVEGAFAVWQNDNSMMPRFAPGELLYCNPFRPAATGDDVVVVVSDGRGQSLGRVRRLLGLHIDVLELRTLAPEGTEIVQRERVRSLAVVIGMRPRGAWHQMFSATAVAMNCIRASSGMAIGFFTGAVKVRVPSMMSPAGEMREMRNSTIKTAASASA